MKFIQDDGGRRAAGYQSRAGDCVARAIAIASGRPYGEIYDALAMGNARQRITKHSKKSTAGRRTASAGINTGRKWFKDYMRSLGFTWVPTMQIGSGCTVHLHDGELPMGRLVVAVSRHYTAVINGVVHDTYDPQREITEHGPYDPKTKRNPIIAVRRRCVYGYWILQ
jgi:hypothetical protein